MMKGERRKTEWVYGRIVNFEQSDHEVDDKVESLTSALGGFELKGETGLEAELLPPHSQYELSR